MKACRFTLSGSDAIRGAILTVGYVLVGILGGLLAVMGSLLSGQSWGTILASYPIGGMLLVFLAALIAFARPARPGGGRRSGTDSGSAPTPWSAPDGKIGAV